MMWETAYKKLIEKNHEIILSSRVLEMKKEKDNYYVVTTEGGKEFIAKNILLIISQKF